MPESSFSASQAMPPRPMPLQSMPPQAEVLPVSDGVVSEVASWANANAAAPNAVAPNAVAPGLSSIATQNAASSIAPRSQKSSSRATPWGRWIGWGLLAVVVTISSAAYGAYATWARGQSIAPGVQIQGENVGGMSAVAARRRLNTRFGRLFVQVNTPERPYRLALRELGGQPRIDQAIKNAYWYGRSGNVLRNMVRVLAPGDDKLRLRLAMRWDKARLRRTMWTVASNYRRAPQNAVLLVSDEGVQVQPEKLGRSLNVGETLKQLQKRYYVGRPDVEAAVRSVWPRLTAARLAGTDVRLGEYPTRFDSDLEGRTRNIHVAAEAINGKVLMSGQTFSFNQMTGERTWDKGYRMAHIFETKPGADKAEVVDGLAGGVCQVSSTLFNAVRKVNKKTNRRLKVIERNTHSLPVTYVPSGLDATVAWPGKDFRFRNTFPHPVYVRAAVEGSHLRISLWGRVPDNVASVTTSPDDEQASTKPQRHADAR